MTLSRIQQLTLSRLWFLTLFLPALVLAQAPQRVIEKMSWRTEPIRIQQVRTNGTIVELGKKFQQDENWLRGLSVSVQNLSNKAIARIEINLSFPRAESVSSDTAIYVTTLIHGLEPTDVPSGETPKLLLPGDSAEVRLIESNVPLIKQDLASLGYPEEITRARLMVSSVTFSDGSTWAGDEILYPDPKDPKRKINPRLQKGPTLLHAV